MSPEEPPLVQLRICVMARTDAVADSVQRLLEVASRDRSFIWFVEQRTLLRSSTPPPPNKETP